MAAGSGLWRRRWRERWTAAGGRRLALWLVAEVALVNLVHQVLQLVLLLRAGAHGSDFITFYATSRMVLDGQGGRLYDLGLQHAAQTAVAVGWTPPRFLPFVNPPVAGLLVAPLALLPWVPAYIAWAALLASASAAALVVLAREAGFRRGGAALACLVMAAFAPLAVTVVQGQPDALVLLSLVVGLAAWRRGWDGRAGAFFAVGLLKPQLILLIPLVLLAARSRRGVSGFLVTAVGMVVVPGLAFGWQVWPQLLALDGPGLLDRRGTWSAGFGASFNLAGLLDWLPPGLRLVPLLAALGVVSWLLLRGHIARGDDLALAVAGSVALTPHAFTHDLTLLVLPGCWVAARLLAQVDPVEGEGQASSQTGWEVPALLAVGLGVPWFAITLGVGERPAAQWATVLLLTAVLVAVLVKREPSLASRGRTVSPT